MDGYKKKYFLLLGLLPVLLILVYNLTISKTIELSGKISGLKHDVSQTSLAPANINMLSRQLDYLKTKVGKSSKNSEVESLFTDISDYCRKHNLKLKSFPAAHSVSRSRYLCRTSIITIEGSFKKLLKLIYYFEYKKNKLMRSVSFDMVRDRISKKDKLQLKIYMQSINYGKD